MAKEKKNPESEEEKNNSESEKQVSAPSVTPPEEKTEKVESGEEPSKFVPKYSQFATDSIEEYVKRVEDAYGSSSSEGQRLAGKLKEREQEMEVLRKLIQSDPDLKSKMSEKLYNTEYADEFTEDPTIQPIVQAVRQVVREEFPHLLNQNPVLQKMDAESKAKDKAILEKFEKENPEIATNPALQRELETAFGALAAISAQNKETFDFEKTLYKAWDIVSRGENETKSMVERENASMSGMVTPTGGAKQQQKILSDAEKAIAAKLGLSEEDYLEGKKLTESK